MSIYVTKSFLPPLVEYNAYIQQIFQSGVLTNNGPLVKEFETKMRHFLETPFFHYVTNGTVALQIALKALNIEDGEIITTPFSYVATSSSILWERSTPVFVDIEPNNFTIDVHKIEQAITPYTKAIMPVHVFGYACDVEVIQKIADKHHLKVIYDAAHAFGSKYKGKPLVSYGDAATLSFHATKLFHTIEGGACIIKEKDVSDKIDLIKKFGIDKEQPISLGINAKQSEFHAAMGLANLNYIHNILNKRKQISQLYDLLLADKIKRPTMQSDLEYNYAYYPVVFSSEQELLKVFKALNEQSIYPRRYFYPSLNTLPYLQTTQNCPVSEDISKRIACLPLYPDLSQEEVTQIAQIICDVIK